MFKAGRATLLPIAPTIFIMSLCPCTGIMGHINCYHNVVLERDHQIGSEGSGMADQYSQIIVDRILDLCRQRGISIYQLAVMSGVSHSTIDNIVNRKTFNPKIKTLHKIALAFSMTVAELLDFDALNRYSFED